MDSVMISPESDAEKSLPEMITSISVMLKRGTAHTRKFINFNRVLSEFLSK
jgi:hypothetical protein